MIREKLNQQYGSPIFQRREQGGGRRQKRKEKAAFFCAPPTDHGAFQSRKALFERLETKRRRRGPE